MRRRCTSWRRPRTPATSRPACRNSIRSATCSAHLQDRRRRLRRAAGCAGHRPGHRRVDLREIPDGRRPGLCGEVLKRQQDDNRRQHARRHSPRACSRRCSSPRRPAAPRSRRTTIRASRRGSSCPYPPGGFNDTLARTVGDRLSKVWKQSVVVDNRPGGNTVLEQPRGQVAA